jgi:molybdenum cofactor synthesis domain-containing protein
VLEPGTLLNASRLGSIAALGLTDVAVYEKPRVAVLSTGNEIVEPGQALAPGQIYDINRVTVSAVVSDNGGVPIPYRTAADTIDDLQRAVDECLEQDVMVFSGGSSVGERDLILDVVAARGEMLFHGIAVKPGKPTAFGRIGGKLFFGMPGYPTSCLSNAYILLAPALRRLARLPQQIVRSLTLPLGARVVSAPRRHQFYSVRVANGTAVPAFKASGDITSMSQADGYIEIAAEVEVVEAGTLVDVKLF